MFDTSGQNSFIQKVFLLFLLLVFLFTPGKASANDSFVSEQNTSARPIKTDKVRMVKENIRVTLYDEAGEALDRRALVNCTFTFKNISAEPVTSPVGFPGAVQWSGEEDPLRRLKDFRASADGSPLKVRIKKEPVESDGAAKTFRYWYVFDVTFPPGTEVVVHNSYVNHLSASVMGDQWFEYILKTGANWNGPIESTVVEVIYESPEDLQRRLLYAYPENFTASGSSLRWEFTDYVPDKDIKVVEFDYRWATYFMEWRASEHMKNRPYEGHTRLYTLADLKPEPIDKYGPPEDENLPGFDDIVKGHIEKPEQNLMQRLSGNVKRALDDKYTRLFARAIRNEIYARRGRPFHSEELNRIFDLSEFYSRDEHYTDSMLNSTELQNIGFILDYEKQNGWQ